MFHQFVFCFQSCWDLSRNFPHLVQNIGWCVLNCFPGTCPSFMDLLQVGWDTLISLGTMKWMCDYAFNFMKLKAFCGVCVFSTSFEILCVIFQCLAVLLGLDFLIFPRPFITNMYSCIFRFSFPDVFLCDILEFAEFVKRLIDPKFKKSWQNQAPYSWVEGS